MIRRTPRAADGDNVESLSLSLIGDNMAISCGRRNQIPKRQASARNHIAKRREGRPFYSALWASNAHWLPSSHWECVLIEYCGSSCGYSYSRGCGRWIA